MAILGGSKKAQTPLRNIKMVPRDNYGIYKFYLVGIHQLRWQDYLGSLQKTC